MRNFLLLGIMVIALLLRTIGLHNHPAGFTPDEASFGYDAYSLLQTGKDQWGDPWPLSFKSFGDYKLPLYGYILMPFISIFGLNEFSVRLPNTLVGTAAVAVTYFLTKKLFPKDERIAFLSAFLLAVSPWHIPMSRGAFEANLTTFLLPLGIWAFLKGLENNKYFLLTALAFGLNLFSYHSARLVTPLIVIVLFVLYYKKIKFSPVSVASMTLLVLTLFLSALTMLGKGGGRLATSGIYSEAGYSAAFANRHEAVISGLPNFLAFLFNNKFVFIFHQFVENYVKYFSIPFFWTDGPAEGTYGMMPGFGVLHWFESIFIVGFVFWLVNNFKDKSAVLLTSWLLIAPVPAALSLGPGYAANRAEIILPALHIASTIGGVYLFNYLKKLVSPKLIFVTFALVATISMSFFVEEYFFQQPIDQGKAMIFGTRQIFEKINTSSCNAEMIVVDKSISEGHIYPTFYNQIDPIIYQSATSQWNFEEMGLQWVDQQPEYKLESYVFRGVDVNNEANRDDPTKLVVTDKVSEFVPVDTILSPAGEPIYYIYCFE